MGDANAPAADGSLRDVDLKTIMLAAYKEHILVPAFNVAYVPMVRPIVDTLKRLGCFGLAEVARPDVEKFGAESFQAVAEEFSRRADRAFVRLHLDHVPVLDEDGLDVDWQGLIGQALALGYDSVMVDGSRLPLDENIRCTRTVVDMARPRGVAVEAEVGAVLGHGDGPLPPYEELFRSGRGFTDVEEAQRFVVESGVDWLSVAFGSVHGAISGAAKSEKKVEARLNVDHLRRLSQVAGVPLVLHGGSSVQRESVLAAIREGITKINIGMDVRQPYERAIAEGRGVEAAQEAVACRIEQLVRDTYGIDGSAAKLSATASER